MRKPVKNIVFISFSLALFLALFSACAEGGVSIEENTYFGDGYISLSKPELAAVSRAVVEKLCKEDPECKAEPDSTIRFVDVQKETDGQGYSINVCYEKSPAPEAPHERICLGDSAASDIKVRYLISVGEDYSTAGAILDVGKVHFGGIDLTDPMKPYVNQSEINLSSGRYGIFVEIEGMVFMIDAFQFQGPDGYAFCPGCRVLSSQEMDELYPPYDEDIDEEESEDEYEEPTYPIASIKVTKMLSQSDKRISIYSVCYSKLESKDSEDVTICSDDPEWSGLQIRFFFIEMMYGKYYGVELEPNKAYFNGVDLSSKITIKKEAFDLPVGRYTLFIQIEGLHKKIASFRS